MPKDFVFHWNEPELPQTPDPAAPDMPAELAAAFDKLPEGVRRSMATPPRRGDGGKVRVEVCAGALRHAGWSMGQANELARFFPSGLGNLGDLTTKTIVDFWIGLDEKEAKERAGGLARDRAMREGSISALLDMEFPPEVHLLGPLITQTTRMVLAGPKGAGKSLIILGMACGMASGQGYGPWASSRPCKVLVIDGEMPRAPMKKRIHAMLRGIGGRDAVEGCLFYVSHEKPIAIPGSDAKWGYLNTEDGQAYILGLCDLFQPDVIIFDNLQSLLRGSMKEEEAWADTKPLVMALTSRNVAQIWVDHTSRAAEHVYGSDTKLWGVDTVGIIKRTRTEPIPGRVEVRLSFGDKFRFADDDTAAAYTPLDISFIAGEWSFKTDEKPKGKRAAEPSVGPKAFSFYKALIAAIADPAPEGERWMQGRTTRDRWLAKCKFMGLDCAIGKDATARFRSAQHELVTASWIGTAGEVVSDMRRLEENGGNP